MGARVTTARARPVGRRRDRASLIRLIHVGARELGLIDASSTGSDRDHLYRALIGAVTGDGRTSCNDLSNEELEEVLRSLRRSGFKVQATPKYRYGRAPNNMSPKDMRAKIEALLTDMELNWGYAEAILRHQRGLPKEVACPISGATGLELRGLVAALAREQDKRALLREVDDELARRGMSRDDLSRRAGLASGWERRIDSLRAARAMLLSMTRHERAEA